MDKKFAQSQDEYRKLDTDSLEEVKHSASSEADDDF